MKSIRVSFTLHLPDDQAEALMSDQTFIPRTVLAALGPNDAVRMDDFAAADGTDAGGTDAGGSWGLTSRND